MPDWAALTRGSLLGEGGGREEGGLVEVGTIEVSWKKEIKKEYWANGECIKTINSKVIPYHYNYYTYGVFYNYL